MNTALPDTRIVLSGLWVAVMLTYLLGDVLRVFSGHATPGKIEGVEATQWMWLGASVLMLLPILMLVFSLTLPYPTIRYLTIGIAGFLIVFNIIGLPYIGWYDNFLIVVSLVFKGMLIWYAWKWVSIT